MQNFGRSTLWGAALMALAGCSGPAQMIDPAQVSRVGYERAFAGCCDTSGGIPQALYDFGEAHSLWIVPTLREIVLREAYLFHDEAAQVAILDRLRPMDVMLINNHSRASGATGAGFFGHSLVYLGGEAELRAMGMWDDPIVQQHKAAFRAGARAIEAVGQDVSLASDHMFEADSVAIFRPVGLSEARRKQIYPALLREVGHPFDVNFRLNNGDALFCTELIDKAMPELNFPRHTYKGHELILPDEVAIAALTGKSPMRFVGYFEGSLSGFREGSRDKMAARIMEGWGLRLENEP
ncbi:MAG: hypothetical protein ACRBCL_11805 [Maritimibacter sp.]